VNRGRLLAFEGLDGCGKSTQVAALARALREAGRDVLATHEPTDGPWGRRIREMARAGEPVTVAEELRWFVEDRRAHVAETLEPALRAGQVVLTDRYFLSTVAYQGARGLDPEQILADSEAEFPLPDLALLLEVEPALGLERVRARGGKLESVFEDPERLTQVAEVFRSLDRPYIERIDASGPPDTVEHTIRTRIEQRLDLF
jgi:dTMP kinase